jgi:hypothetical protein
MMHSGLPAAQEQLMHALIALLAMIFMSHAATANHNIVPEHASVTIDQTLPTRAEVARIRTATVYAGTECMTCRRTSVIYTAR